MAQNQVPPAPRAGLYVDGFNLYHAVDKLNEPFLKWLDLWKLGTLLAAPHGADLKKVYFCTALNNNDMDKFTRHGLYNAALAATGCEVIKGHYIWDSDANKWTEKQSDINVALHLILDAEDDEIDIAFLISADSDQAATGRLFKQRHPQRKLIIAVPPGKDIPKKVAPYADDSFAISKDQIERCLLPDPVPGTKLAISRPPQYAPPSWWMPPDQRPSRKKR